MILDQNSPDSRDEKGIQAGLYVSKDNALSSSSGRCERTLPEGHTVLPLPSTAHWFCLSPDGMN